MADKGRWEHHKGPKTFCDLRLTTSIVDVAHVLHCVAFECTAYQPRWPVQKQASQNQLANSVAQY